MLALISDLLGFVGSILLAWPFFVRQRPRDDRDLLNSVPVADPHARQAVDAIRDELSRMIDRAARDDFRIAGVGAALLALGFLLSLVNGLAGPN